MGDCDPAKEDKIADRYMTFVSKVEDTFEIQERGFVIVLAALSGSDFRLHKEDPIQMRTPEGKVIETRIASIELIKPVSGPCQMALLLPRDIVRSDIPADTEIWVRDGSS